MKTSDVDKSLKFTDFENFLDIYPDSSLPNTPYRFNLNSTIYFIGLPQGTKTVTHDTFWTTLSYQIYGTTRLWWVLMKVNGVGMDTAFSPVRSSSEVKYIPKETLRGIITNLGR